MVHQVRIILVRYLIDHELLVKLANHVRRRGNCNPKNWSRETAPPRKPSKLHSELFAVYGARGTAAKERNDSRRNNSNSLGRSSRQPCIRTKLAKNARQQVFVS